jgi:membrane-associated phospholipid phosphatase
MIRHIIYSKQILFVLAIVLYNRCYTQTITSTPRDTAVSVTNTLFSSQLSQTPNTDSFRESGESNPFKRIGKDLLIQAGAPFHMSVGDAWWVGAGVLTTAVLLASDQGSYNSVKEEQFDTHWIGKVSPVVTQFGSNYGIGVIGVWAMYGFAASDTKAKETAYLASEAFLTSGMWGIVIKTLTSRQRPSTESEKAGEWSGPFGYFRKHKNQSISSFDAFPSGHTLTAFSIATVFAEQYSENPVVPVFCYTAASLVGISRLTENAHWASDVFVGGVLGYLTAKEIVINNPSETSRKNNTAMRVHLGLSVEPVHGDPALQVQVQF